MGLAQAVLAVVEDVAQSRRVRRVRLRVGTGQAVVADSLEFGFELLAEGTCAAGATLEVVSVQGDSVRVDEVELDADPPEVIRRPDLDVAEAPHDETPAHRHPAWL